MECPEEIPLSIPCFLKQRLEDDCFWISRRGKLVCLPAESNVTAVLRGYYKYCLQQPSSGDTNFSLLAEVLDGVKVYFDFMLPDHLLYSQEKLQFKRLTEEHGFGRASTVARVPQAHPSLHKSTSSHSRSSTKPIPSSLPSDVYGVEHLLRLFVRLPMFLSKAHLPTSHVNIIQSHLKDLLEYLSNQKSLFSESHYEDSTSPRSNGLDPVHVPPTLTNNIDNTGQ